MYHDSGEHMNLNVQEAQGASRGTGLPIMSQETRGVYWRGALDLSVTQLVGHSNAEKKLESLLGTNLVLVQWSQPLFDRDCSGRIGIMSRHFVKCWTYWSKWRIKIVLLYLLNQTS